MNRKHLLPGALLLVIGSLPLLAQVSIPNTFTAGTPAVASEVNANFTALKDAIESLQAEVASLKSELTEVQANTVMELDGHVSLIPDDNSVNDFRVLFSGVNVQIVNDEGQRTPNGVGNLIVGYDNERAGFFASSVCSKGQYVTQVDCEENFGLWAANHKSGSHNIVVGDENAYSATGGLLAGTRNVVNRRDASVVGGFANVASGISSNVNGGAVNNASGQHSSIGGGISNTASGLTSSISGGRFNTATTSNSSILGGDTQTTDASEQTIPALP